MPSLAFFTGLTSSDYNRIPHEHRTGSLYIIHIMQNFFFNSFIQDTPKSKPNWKLDSISLS